MCLLVGEERRWRRRMRPGPVVAPARATVAIFDGLGEGVLVGVGKCCWSERYSSSEYLKRSIDRLINIKTKSQTTKFDIKVES